MTKTIAIACVLALMSIGAACAAPTVYNIDPTHTYPSFEADHMGISVWRGKFNKTVGTVNLDKAAGTGSVDLTIDLSSIDFGLEAMNAWAKGDKFFDVANHPKATYKGQLTGFVNGAPTKLNGALSLRGFTKPVVLTINSFKCIVHPLLKRELCGADATANFNRADFGLDAGKDWGFKMDVALRIQVEAVQAE